MPNKDSLSHELTVHNLILRKLMFDRAKSEHERSQIALNYFKHDAADLINHLKEVIEDGKA